ncbi:MAG: hypothetical protein HY060_15220 [Proteobacteria bacterium]|nr:hypothetical protein [Pseudomonadota bacterium]
MARTAQATSDRHVGARAALPVLVGIVVIALFVLGLLLGGRAEDDFTYFAGLAFAGFSLLVGWRYLDRLLP